MVELRFSEARFSAEVAGVPGYRSPADVETIGSQARRKLRDQLSASLAYVLDRGRIVRDTASCSGMRGKEAA